MSEKQKQFDANFNDIDLVGEFVKLKKMSKELEEKMSALELLIFSNPDLRKDERIKITAGRKSITLKDECYEILEIAGVETEIIEKRKKKLEEFDIAVQEKILSEPSNYVEKITKESIRIK